MTKQWRLVLKLAKVEHSIYFEGSDEEAQQALQEARACVERGGPATIAGKLFVVDAADIVVVSLYEVSGSR